MSKPRILCRRRILYRSAGTLERILRRRPNRSRDIRDRSTMAPRCPSVSQAYAWVARLSTLLVGRWPLKVRVLKGTGNGHLWAGVGLGACELVARGVAPLDSRIRCRIAFADLQISRTPRYLPIPRGNPSSDQVPSCILPRPVATTSLLSAAIRIRFRRHSHLLTTRRLSCHLTANQICISGCRLITRGYSVHRWETS